MNHDEILFGSGFMQDRINNKDQWNENEQYFYDYLGDYYDISSLNELKELIKGYFGDISIEQLKEIINIYESNSEDIQAPFTKEDFLNEIGELLYPHYEKIHWGKNINKKKLIEFLGMGKTWDKRKTSRISTYRKVCFILKEKVKDVSLFKECQKLINRIKSSEIIQNEQVEFTLIIESLQDLYVLYVNPTKVDFTSKVFSKMIYGSNRSYYISTRMGKKSIPSTGTRDAGHLKLSTYLKLENRILKLELNNTNIKTEIELKRFKFQAIAMIRWHFIKENFVHISSIPEASILFRIVHLKHDQNYDDFSEELGNIAPSHYDYLKGLMFFGNEILLNIEKQKSNLNKSEELDFLRVLLGHYKENYLGKSFRHLRVGSISHIHLEGISAIHFSKNNITFKNEKFSNYPNSLHRIDLWIKLDDKLKKFIDKNIFPLINLKIDYLNEISIDFTILSKKGNEHIIKKLYKHYQQKDRALLIVLYGKYFKNDIINIQNEIYKIKDDSLFIENCKVITYQDFLILFRFNKYYINLMTEISDLSSQVLTSGKYSDKAFKNLQELIIY